MRQRAKAVRASRPRPDPRGYPASRSRCAHKDRQDARRWRPETSLQPRGGQSGHGVARTCVTRKGRTALPSALRPNSRRPLLARRPKAASRKAAAPPLELPLLLSDTSGHEAMPALHDRASANAVSTRVARRTRRQIARPHAIAHGVAGRVPDGGTPSPSRT